MRRQSFHAERMTKAQNRLAFTMWLNGCTDDALCRAEPASLVRSYGLSAEEVGRLIGAQKMARRLAS